MNRRKNGEIAAMEVESGAEVLAEVAPDPEANPQTDGVVIGVLSGSDVFGSPLVTFEGSPGGCPVVARTAVRVAEEDRGRKVALMFENGDTCRPIILGLVRSGAGVTDGGAARECDVDGERVVLEANKEIVLRCGKASIVLTKAGKILIRGAYVLSRAAGTNSIKGGSIQLN